MRPIHFKMLIIACSMSLKFIAQPTLNNSNCNPLIGDAFLYNRTNSVSPGSAGANQTWNLSAMTATASNSSSFVAMAQTPTPSVPNANLSLNTGTLYLYYKTSAGALQNCSGVANSTTTFSYTDPEDILHYPFNFNSSFTDTWAGSYFVVSVNITRTGTTTVTADGHGTLITPAGTYTNVMRVHIYSNIVDAVGASTFVTNRMHDEYRWYAPNIRYHVASVYTTTNSVNSDPSGGMYVSGYTVGLEENNTWANTLSIFPIPASEKIQLNFTEHTPQALEIGLYNVTGQKLKEITLYPKSEKDTELNVSDLPNGIYFIHLKSEYGTLSKKIVIAK